MNQLKRDGLQLKIILIQAVLLYLVTNVLSMALKAEKNDGDERSILLHIGILSPFNDDPVIIIKQKEI